MIDEHNELFISLKEKIKNIISLYEKSKKEKEELSDEKLSFINQIKEKDKEIEELKNKYNILKLAKTFRASDNDKSDAKNKINRIVREVENCIALLNK